jgi:putative ribosome biogenesis GTPase RsgA
MERIKGIRNDFLKDKISLVSGHSGVGKSTLINTFTTSIDLIVASDHSGKGTTHDDFCRNAII